MLSVMSGRIALVLDHFYSCGSTIIDTYVHLSASEHPHIRAKQVQGVCMWFLCPMIFVRAHMQATSYEHVSRGNTFIYNLYFLFCYAFKVAMVTQPQLYVGK